MYYNRRVQVMPAQPSALEPEDEEEQVMEEEEQDRRRRCNGEAEHEVGGGGGGGGGEGEETMEDSTEERDSDLEESDDGDEEEGEEEEEEEEGESSEMDDEDCERRRGECLDEMTDLEKQFHDLKDKLFRERVSQVKERLEEVLTGRAGDYRERLSSLQGSTQLRTQVAGVYRELCLQVIKHKYECELQGARQHLESERTLLLDAMKTELLDKIRRLEEDRESTEWWSDDVKSKKCKRKNLLARSDRKKKAALVSGPYIVYMLRDIDIMEDWAAIKKAKAALTPLKKKTEKR
ncbi:breast cancer metastasis-suppressor 1 isoform X1 [Gadus macrocephalus]|uniref:breast cancer metastasis-suppressor 1 isoform X1 n=3 Tax=Gadus TaxID=8048 RepID=UPI0028CBB0D8|nr:breast cancer metastasis-suppressor 1 isoform X1 [Gadus macrocephalus]